MSNVAAGTVWNLPNFVGEIYTASAEQTKFLNMIGGLSGGGLQTQNFEFPVDQEFAHEAAAQPAITETASLTAPTAISYVRAQNKNVCQIFMEKVSMSYERMSNQQRLSGIATAGTMETPTDERTWQIQKALKKIARDMEYTALNGAYQIATSASVANKTRGVIAAASNTTAAGSVRLTKSLFDTTFQAMYDAGALFTNIVIWVGGFQKRQTSQIYGYAPTDRNVGGVNVKAIETDFGTMGIELNRFMPAGTVLIADMAYIKPVFQPVPDKGNFFYEPLSKAGASEDGQIYGKFGVAHGPGFMHGTITGLATS